MTTRLSAAAVAALLALPVAGRAAPSGDPAEREAKARAYFTNTALKDQAGKPRRFYDDVLRGHVVLLSFMFTRCFDACPLITRKMNAVRTELGDRFGPDVQFVSLSVDPENDPPAELRKFAEKQRAVSPAWTFLTGRKADVQLVLRKLGQLGDEPGDHYTGFIVGNVRTGHWQKVRPDAPAATVAEMLRRLADEERAPAAPGREQASAAVPAAAAR
ncbi:SCO family protein [Anaeromyxobacter oryzae]|uniref:SCO family protein n=1 Tax=Anaeromyxobacter oryzae TaxID=2918170 RepID=A0ABM7WX19_9BACT|nr:SCO family protein [Anaeromyxobacter oryzae]BDG04030.1 SCO family protein [Anaeromyxobacter oryzae]